MRLAVGEPAPNGSSDPGRGVGVDRVHVERDVHVAGSGDVVERALHHLLEPEPIDVAHRVDLHPELADELSLGLVKRAGSDDDDTARLNHRQRPLRALETAARQPQCGGEHHPVHVPARARLGAIEIAVGVDVENAARPVHRGQRPQRAERDRVVAAEHEREGALLQRLVHEPGDLLADRLHLGQKARMLVTQTGRLDDRGRDVAPVVDLEPHLRQTPVESRVADRGGAHVDAAAAGTEVERRADHDDGL